MTGKYLKHVKPILNRIIIKRKQEQRTGLIYIPEAYQSPDKLVEVIAVGPDVKEVKKGMTVLVPGMALKHPDFEQDEYAMITEEDVGLIYAA